MTRKQLGRRERYLRWKVRIRADPQRYKDWLYYHARYKREKISPPRPLPFVPTALPLPQQPWEE